MSHTPRPFCFLPILRATQRKQQQHQRQQAALPPAIRVLTEAADKLRPLGNHPALPAVLRRTARAWLRTWATLNSTAATTTASQTASALFAVASPSPSPPKHTRGTPGHNPAAQADPADPGDGGVETPVPGGGGVGSAERCLENAVACLAEARAVLSALAAVAEPAGDVLSSAPVTAREEKAVGGDGEDEAEAAAAAASGKAGGKGKGGGAEKKGGAKKGAAAAAAAKAAEETGEGSSGEEPPEAAGGGAAISTPLGRSLVMVQLEEACVRTMLGRARGEGRSSKKAKEAAANAEGITPVQR